MGADEASSSADANFDDPIGTNLLGMLGFEVTCEIVSHFAGQVCVFFKQETMNSIVRKIYWQSAMIDLLKFRIASIIHPQIRRSFSLLRRAARPRRISPSCVVCVVFCVLRFAAFHFSKNGPGIQDPGPNLPNRSTK